ncbi:hypothetical protein QTP70_016700 [Hemibagrus guttatus]|uniref:Reverse transcriptase domain-containing protein n=1 Tax=Hemibagrus guttatus TaxID=175788 RepID=A0AAE0RIP8_9TELE|nr:hypothetical protein QTP70_016700 [Hemibagrus guttatus]
MHSSKHIVKFADDTTMVGLISKNDESAYREEVQRLTAWCRANNLSLNVDKTKEMVVDFRRAQSDHSPLFIDGSPVEIVKSTKFLGVHLVENFTWSLNTSSISKKVRQRLYFLRRLRKAHLPPPILTMFYRRTIESVLSSCITAWFGNCTASDRKTLQRIVKTAEKIIGVSLPSITDTPGNYARILFVDFSSAFNTIIPDLLQTKLIKISVPTLICQWITNFLTVRQQQVRVWKLTSGSLTISTDTPQGCIWSPLLFSLYMNDSTATDPSVKLLKFADDTMVIGLISNGD